MALIILPAGAIKAMLFDTDLIKMYWVNNHLY